MATIKPQALAALACVVWASTARAASELPAPLESQLVPAQTSLYQPWDPALDPVIPVPIPPSRAIGMLGLVGLGIYVRGRRRYIAKRAAIWPPPSDR